MKPLPIDGVFDIECSEWDRFLIGAVLWRDGDYLETRDLDEWYDGLLSRGGHLWGHYAGYYDTIEVLDVAERRGDPWIASPQGPRISRVTIKGTTLHDSHALIPMPLEKAALMGNDKAFAKTRLPPDLFPCPGHGPELIDCGGYCQLREDMSNEQWRAVKEYLHNDCRALLYGALLPLAERAADVGIPLAGTIGGTAWNSIQSSTGITKCEWDHPILYRLAERAKRGGRCEVYRTRAASGYAYDIQSAYPAALERVPVPVGECIVIHGERARRAFDLELPGIYAATVDVPEQHIPPLPTRINGRPCYPWGRIRDSWALPELHYAVSEGLAELVSIEHAVIWGDTDRPLAEWMRHWWTERANSAKDSPTWSAWLKWKVNSATGKLGQDPRGETLLGHPDPRRIKVCPGDCPPHRHYCGAWRIVGESIYAAPRWRLPDHGYVHWNAYLTGANRTEFHRMVTADEQGGLTACMGDTDSCYATTRRFYNVGEDLGQWSEDEPWIRLRAHAPKAYDYEYVRDSDDGKHKAGEHETRLKGVPKATTRDFDAYTRGVKVHRDSGVMGIRSGARAALNDDDDKRLFRRRSLDRASLPQDGWIGARILVGDGPLTRAPSVAEVRARF